MTKVQYFNIVLKETERIIEFANAHDYDDYITVYSATTRSMMHDVVNFYDTAQAVRGMLFQTMVKQ